MEATKTIEGMVGWVNLQPFIAGAILDVGGEEQCHLNRPQLRRLKNTIDDMIKHEIIEKVK